MVVNPKVSQHPDLILKALAGISVDLPTFKAWAATATPSLGTSVTVGNRIYTYDGTSNHEPGLIGWTSGFKPLVVAVLGQSNARSSTQSTGGSHTLDPMVFFWNQNSLDNNAMVAGTQWLPAAFGTPPLNIGAAPYSNSIAFSYGKRRRAATGRPVYIIQIAAGAHSIQSFIPASVRTANGWAVQGGNQDLTAFMYPGIANALAAIPGAPTTIDEVIWIQGEANQDDQVEVYAAMLVAANTGLATAGLIDLDTTPIAISKLLDSLGNPQRLRHYNACVRAQESLPTLRIVDSAGLLPAVADDVHYTGTGLVEMGKRFAAAIALPPVRVDWSKEPIRLGVDYGLQSFTAQANNAQSDLAKRPPLAVDSTLTIENHATLGWCFKSAANVARIFASRRLFPVPKGGVITIAYEAMATDVGATVDMRLTVYEYTAAKVLIGAKTFTPHNAVLTDAMGRTTYRARFGRATECDVVLSANCDFFAYAFFGGSGANDEAFYFNITEMGTAPYIASSGPAGPFLNLSNIDVVTSMKAPAVISGAATLTVANLQAPLINYTGAAAALTFPTGATLDTLLASDDSGFQFSVINTGSGTVTMTANTGVTIVGSATVAAGSSALWALRRTAASTYVAYRIS